MVNVAGRSRTSAKGGGKRTGFIYKPRTIEDVKRREEQSDNRFDSPFKQGFDVYRPKQGDNALRILPATWDDHEHYGLDVYVHPYVGPDSSTYICPAKMKGERCAFCEAQREAHDAGEEDEAKVLYWRRRVLYWVLDRDDDSTTPQLYMVSKTMDDDILSRCHIKKTGSILLIDHPDEGYDIFIKRKGSGLKTRYTCEIDREPSAISDSGKTQDEIMEYIMENPLPSVLKFYSEEYLDKVISGTAPAKDKELDDDEEEEQQEEEVKEEEDEKPRRRGAKDEEAEEEEEKPRSRRRKDEEDGEDYEEEKPRGRARKDEEVEGEDPEEEDSKPRGRGRKDDNEEDEDEKPRSRSRGKAEEEEEEEKPRHRKDEEDEERPRRERISSSKNKKRR